MPELPEVVEKIRTESDYLERNANHALPSPAAGRACQHGGQQR